MSDELPGESVWGTVNALDRCRSDIAEYRRKAALYDDLVAALDKAVANYAGINERNCPAWLTDARAVLSRAREKQP